MASFNKVILIGNMVADPELKQTENGIPVTSFRIAVGRNYVKQGEPQQTDFIDIVCWRRNAEFVTKYFSKGKAILVCGSLQTRTWVDNNNQKRYVTEVIADEVNFVEKKSNDGNTSSSAYATPSYSTPKVEGSFEELEADDELPF
ncbi:single-stranded DNA-binding protein [Eubacteriales bacterium OttesenSCG-928-G02]|nr:single-stranded DNA-binding protein [Eubacteriales bacterium OttesenSCG-928-G02]